MSNQDPRTPGGCAGAEAGRTAPHRPALGRGDWTLQFTQWDGAWMSPNRSPLCSQTFGKCKASHSPISIPARWRPSRLAALSLSSAGGAFYFGRGIFR